jgi:hypothetical protein
MKLLSVGGGSTSELLGSPDELGGCTHDDEGTTQDDELTQRLELDQPDELPEQLSQQQHPAWWLTAQEPSSRVRPLMPCAVVAPGSHRWASLEVTLGAARVKPPSVEKL